MKLDTYLSPKELAQVIDASESTIKRWVDKGIITAEITEGGHRRIAVESVVQYVRQNRRKVYRADFLGFPDVNVLQDTPLSSGLNPDLFFDFLIAGDAEKARGYLVKLYFQGASIAEICDAVVAPCMNRIGVLWEQQASGICIEHHATDVCIQAVNALRSIFHPKPDAAVALGGAPEHDPYMIPSLCTAALFLSEGFRAVNLGPHTPASSFEQAVSQYRPQLVWISFSSKLRPRLSVQQIETLVERLSAQSVQVIIGGKASLAYRSLLNRKVFFGENMTELAAFLRGFQSFSILP